MWSTGNHEILTWETKCKMVFQGDQFHITFEIKISGCFQPIKCLKKT